MKPIMIESKLPKFLVVNPAVEKESVNKHLLRPWKGGEIVKVAPYDEQVPSTAFNHNLKYVKADPSPWKFRKKYVVVYRKDDNGKFTLKHSASWDKFNLIVAKKHAK